MIFANHIPPDRSLRQTLVRTAHSKSLRANIKTCDRELDRSPSNTMVAIMGQVPAVLYVAIAAANSFFLVRLVRNTSLVRKYYTCHLCVRTFAADLLTPIYRCLMVISNQKSFEVLITVGFWNFPVNLMNCLIALYVHRNTLAISITS